MNEPQATTNKTTSSSFHPLVINTRLVPQFVVKKPVSYNKNTHINFSLTQQHLRYQIKKDVESWYIRFKYRDGDVWMKSIIGRSTQPLKSSANSTRNS